MSSTQNLTNGVYEDVMNYVLNRYKTLPSSTSVHNSTINQKISSLKENMSTSLSSNRTKHATMDIYRPPSLRDGFLSSTGQTRLNVHAKEFVMSSSNTKPTCNDEKFIKQDEFKTTKKFDSSCSLNLLKSSANAFSLTKLDSSPFRYNNNQNFTGSSSSTDHYDLQRAKSSGNVLLENNVGISNSKIQLKTLCLERNHQNISGKTSPTKKSPPNIGHQILPGKLKRSKSLNAADALKFIALEASLTASSRMFTEYNLYPEKFHGIIRQAVDHTNEMEDKNKIVLARAIVEHTLNNKNLSLSSAKLSVIIMNKDKTGAYLDSLLNTCQMLYQLKKENCLADRAKLITFLAFLQGLYVELKRSNVQLRLLTDSLTPPKMSFLILITRCCEDILLRSETHSVTEMECLFSTLTSVGRDIEVEIPNIFRRLFNLMKELLLQSRNEPAVQKILLQLIELRAANWQLPISALNYYYPKSLI